MFQLFGGTCSRRFLLPAMAWVTFANEYDADFNIPAVSKPLAPCRRLDLETTAARAREIPCELGARFKAVPLFAPATCRNREGQRDVTFPRVKNLHSK